MENDLNVKPLNTSNNSLLKNRLFIIIVSVYVVFQVLSLAFTPNKNKGFASDLSYDNILNAVNRERTLRNLTALNTNDKLSLAAQSKSNDMQARHYFAHVDPDGNYIWDKIVAAGYTPYLQLGENLAIEFYDTESLVQAWMNSPTHRANILQEGFHDQGMGINLGDTAFGQYHSAITNTFGTLAYQKTKSPVSNTPPSTPTQTKPKSPTPITQKPPESATAEIIVPTTSPVQSTINTSTPEIPKLTNPIKIRGEDKIAVEDSFSLPNNASSSEETNSVINETAQPQIALIGNSNSTQNLDYEINRYLILVSGIALLLLLLTDIKDAINKKFASLDKKINNFFVLLISLLVIAFLYWL